MLQRWMYRTGTFSISSLHVSSSSFSRLKELRLWSENIRLISEAKEALENLKFAELVFSNLSTSMKAAIANAQTVLEPFQHGK